jgi:6-phosphogluconolactonase
MTSKAQIIAESIADSFRSELSRTSSASLVVCGGSSPIEIFSYLNLQEIDWSLITIFLVDDRLVDPQSEHSNQHLIKTHLIQNNASLATLIPLSTDFTYLSALPAKFTVTLLGMGTDGHFASLFPDLLSKSESSSLPHSDLHSTSKPRIITTPALGSPSVPRISMNLSLILNSSRIILLANGAEKQAVLAKAETDKTLPVHFLIHQTILPIEIESL